MRLSLLMWIVIPGVIPNVLISTAPSGLARMRSGRKTPPNGYGSNGFRPSPRARLNVAGAAVAVTSRPGVVMLRAAPKTDLLEALPPTPAARPLFRGPG